MLVTTIVKNRKFQKNREDLKKNQMDFFKLKNTITNMKKEQ